MLTIKGKEYYLVYVGKTECECKHCVCKYQYSCIQCNCCIKKHMLPVKETAPTEIVIEV